MAQTTEKQLAAQKRAEARRAKKQARRENQWAQGSLLVFVLVYNLVFQLVLVPLGKAIWAGALNHSPAHYIISDNLGLILRSPLIWLALLVIAVGYAFWALLEITGILLCVDCAQRGHRMGLLALLRRSVLESLPVLRPQNLPLLVFTAVIMPFTNFFVASDLVRQITVPEYIMEVIEDTPLYFGLYLAVNVLLVFWTLAWAMVYHVFVLEHKSLPEAARASIRLMKHRKRATVWRVVVNQIRFFVRWGVVLALGTAAFGAVLMIFSDGSLLFARAATLSWELIVYPAGRFLLSCLATFVQYATLTSLYHNYKEADGEALAPLPPEARPRKRRDALALAAAPVLLLGVAGVGLLFTGLLYAVGLSGEGVLESVLTAQTEITSHRGYSAKAPENTLPSIQAAIDSGVSDYAEIDVQQTSDGVVVLTHDTNLKRCTGLDANVHDVPYEQIRTLDASKGYSGADAAQFAGTPIPTLEEVIRLCKENGMKLNIEIKGATPTLEQETVRIIQENDFGDQCILTSLRYDALEKVKALDPTLKTGYIMAMGVGNYYDLAAADIFSVESTFVTADMVGALHLRGKQVHAWTIDEPANAKRMVRLGVDNLITGEPEMVHEVIQESEQLGWFSYLSTDGWQELAGKLGVDVRAYASVLDAA